MEDRWLLAAATIQLSGKVEWVDSAKKTHGLPLAELEIRDSNGATSTLIKTISTSPTGTFSTSVTYDDGATAPDIFIRVLAKSSVAIVGATAGTPYAFDSSVSPDVADGTNLAKNVKIDNGDAVVDNNESAFSVHHALVMAGQYTSTLAGSAPSRINVVFPETAAGSTSHFNPNTKQLHILQLDRWDWDVIHHEYGHYVQAVHKFVNHPGGNHSFEEHLSVKKGSKSAGTRLAWGEAWPTFFAIACQQRMGGAALNIPNVGDLRYQDTEDSTLDVNVEVKRGVGEDDEMSVIAALWDVLDTASDGGEKVTLSDKKIFDLLKAAGATTVGAAWNALVAGKSAKEKAQYGQAFAYDKIAPELTGPANNFVPGAAPPTFTWNKNGGGAPNPLNDFKIVFYKSDWSSIVFEKAVGDVATFTPTAAEWDTIKAGGSLLQWVVQGRSTNGDAKTPGGDEYYWSGPRTLGAGPKFVFVIDDTGSMGEEIASVRTALQKFIDQVEAGLGAGAPVPTFALITFKDDVTTRIVTNDLAALRTQVAGLFASGGGDCPEFSAQGLAAAAEIIANGGTVLLATDASSQPGVNMGAVVSQLRARGVTVNVILSGDCSGIDSPGGGAPLVASKTIGPAVPAAAGAGTVGGGAKPGAEGDDEIPTAGIDDEGQPAIDDHGDTAETSTRFNADGTPISGRVDGTETTDFLVTELEANSTYLFTVGADDGGGVIVTILASDGSTVLLTEFVSGGTRDFAFTSTTAGDYFVKIETWFGDSTYEVSAVEDPFAGLLSSVDLFSSVAALTNGAFYVLDDVNFGESGPFENAIFNVLRSALLPTVLSSNPSNLPAGQTLSLTLTGRNTNWRPDKTTVSFSGGGITVNSVTVLSATTLTVNITVDAAAAIGFRDATVVADLGSKSETSEGIAVLEVRAPAVGAELFSVDPASLNQGATRNVTLRGANTAWDETTTVQLGPDITINSVTRISPTELRANVSVASDADIGFRTATVTTGEQVLTLQRAVFVNIAAEAIATVGLDIDNGDAGETLTIVLTGVGTNFVDGETTVSFGEGITVNSVTVTSPTTATIQITIDDAAAVGFRNVVVTTGAESATLIDGFFVNEGDGGGGDGGEGFDVSLHPLADTAGGNVRVIHSRRGISIRGDRLSNAVEMFMDGDALVIRGLGDTTINGETEVVLEPDELERRTISVDLGSGDDLLGLHDLILNRSLTVQTGAGDDAIFADSLEIGGSFSVKTGRDDDVVGLSNLSVAGSLTVKSDGGDDRVAISNSTTGRSMFVDLGGGHDLLAASLLEAGSSITFNLRSGNDALWTKDVLAAGNLTASAHSGRDFLITDESVSGRRTRFNSFEFDDFDDDRYQLLSDLLDELAGIGADTSPFE